MAKRNPTRSTDLHLAPNPGQVMRIRGLPEALAKASGLPVPDRRLSDWILAASRALAAATPPPSANARFDAVKDGRKTVAHAIRDDGSVVAVAHGIARRAKIAATIHGAVAGKFAVKEGFRPRKRVRRLSADAAEHESLAADLRTFVRQWRVHHAMRADGPWRSALVVPYLHPICERGIFDEPAPLARRIAVLVVAADDGADARLLDGDTALPIDDDEAIRLLVDDAVRRDQRVPAAALSSVAQTAPEAAAAALGLDGKRFRMPGFSDEAESRAAAPTAAPTAANDVPSPATFVLKPCAARQKSRRPGAPRRPTPLVFPSTRALLSASSACIAAFRHSLSVEARQHAAETSRQRTPRGGGKSGVRDGGRFATARSVADFVVDHAGWTPADHVRAVQATGVLPLLSILLWPGSEHATVPNRAEAEASALLLRDGIRRGDRLAAAVGAALGTPTPLHRKTIDSFRGRLWGVGKVHPHRHVAATLTSVDALYRSNPHHPRLTPDQAAFALDAVSAFHGKLRWNPAFGARLLGAILHDPTARENPDALLEVGDAVLWVYSACNDLLGDRSAALAATADIAFPPGRTRRGVAAFSDTWHGLSRRFVDMTRRFEAECAARRAAVQVDLPPVAYPHFLDAATVVNGVAFAPLRDVDSLVAEGDALGHCVATYDESAISGRSMLVSLASASGRSTAEIRLPAPRRRRQELALEVNQHKGRFNKEPPGGHAGALAALLSSVPAASLPALLDRVAAATARHGDGCRPVLTTDEQSAMNLFVFERQLKRFLPFADRGLDLDAWTAKYVSDEAARPA